jgi:hypothetical protein
VCAEAAEQVKILTRNPNSSIKQPADYFISEALVVAIELKSTSLQVVAGYQSCHSNTVPSLLNLRLPPSIVLQSQYGQDIAFAEG